jgi:hypothetical protein
MTGICCEFYFNKFQLSEKSYLYKPLFFISKMDAS